MSDLDAQITQIVESRGYGLYDIEILRENDIAIFRVSISRIPSAGAKSVDKAKGDNNGGISHEDCQSISEIISPLLDVYNPIDGEYFLEVSSPGLERKLKKPNHFILSVGEKIQITLNDKSKVVGILESANESGFSLCGTKYAYSEIKKAKSVLEW